MFDVSYEDGTWEGLGVIPGEVVRFQNQPDLKIPHIGWNRLDFVNGSSLLADIPAGSFFYFGHSYYVVPSDETVIVARSEHGTRFAAMVQRGNLFATQFHPKTSSASV